MIFRKEFRKVVLGLSLLTSVNLLCAQNVSTKKIDSRETVISNIPSKGNMQFFVTGDDCRIAYQIDGDNDKPVLVLSNSIATNFHMWDAQIPTLGKLFRIIRFDTRGDGASDNPSGDYSIDRMGLDVIELLDYLHIEKVHFCGLSLGGFIGQWLGIHASDRINKLILSNTSSYLGPSSYFNNNIRSLREHPNMKGFADMFIKNWFPEKMITENDSIVSVFRDMVLNTNPQGLAGEFAAVRDADMRKTISLIPVSTLIIAGKYDLVTKPEDSQRMAATIPDSKLIILPAVHISNVLCQNDFEKSVIAFLLAR
jgi:3-oxoadipate enol-lactonase